MFVINARNVNDAYYQGTRFLRTHGMDEDSRAGPVLVAPCPVTTVYNHPYERVLFDAVRDANPFFHLAEALWMLSGSRDARFLDRWVRDFSSRFAEPGGMQHGAYGYRWRRHFKFDQLARVINILKSDRKTRQAVMSMWSPADDLGAAARDIPCNTTIYFRLIPLPEGRSLDMTVCCRSNDMIWGAYGANAVHFSFLQEYVAACIGARVGRYFQISNNFHVYTAIWEKWGDDSVDEGTSYPYHRVGLDGKYTMADTEKFVYRYSVEPVSEGMRSIMEAPYVSDFFAQIVSPLFTAHDVYKVSGARAGIEYLNEKGSSGVDWIEAGKDWFRRRIK